jgi:ABC-type methionine transport system ATPase subunit
LNGTILGASKQDVDSRLDRIIEFSGLGDFINAPVRTYSTGMIARLGFSIATDVRPEILVVDEILGVGDAEFQTKSYERIQGFQRDGTTILLVSHDLGSVEAMCSKGMWLEHGQIIKSGTAKSVIDQYLQRNKDKESDRLASVTIAQDNQRWGSRKAEIISVQLVDENNEPITVLQTGQILNVKIHYNFHEDINNPIFGMAIHRHDGVHITGPNTSHKGLKRNIKKGSGVINYTIKNIPLLEGLYHISVAITNERDTEVFDYHDRAYPFRISNRMNEAVESYGLMTLNGKWQFESMD